MKGQEIWGIMWHLYIVPAEEWVAHCTWLLARPQLHLLHCTSWLMRWQGPANEMHRGLIVQLMRKISPVCQFDIRYSKGDLVADNLGVVVQSASCILGVWGLSWFWFWTYLLSRSVIQHCYWLGKGFLKWKRWKQKGFSLLRWSMFVNNSVWLICRFPARIPLTFAPSILLSVNWASASPLLVDTDESKTLRCWLSFTSYLLPLYSFIHLISCTAFSPLAGHPLSSTCPLFFILSTPLEGSVYIPPSRSL